MNRQTLLNCIRRQLRECVTQTGEARPLGEVVGRIFADIQNREVPTTGSTTVVPVSLVAAFVDGDVTEGEAAAICRAAQTDRSLVAELVAAMRAVESIQINEQPGSSTEAPLPDALSERLMEMTRPHSDRGTFSHDPPRIEVNKPEGTNRPRTTRRTLAWAGSMAAIAATGLLLIYLASRIPGPLPGHREITNHPSIAPPPSPDADRRPGRDLLAPRLDRGAPDAIGPAIADIPPSRVPPSNLPPSDLPPSGVSPDAPDAMLAGDPPARSDPPKPTMPDGDVRSITPPARFAGLRWKQVTGILAGERAHAASTGSRTPATWGSITEDQLSFPDASSVAENIGLKTLPNSRAAADVETGGRLVLRGDSGVRLSAAVGASVVLDLQYGGMAMLDFPVDTVVELRSMNRPLGRLRWSHPATTVLAEHDQGGLVVHIQGDGMMIDGEAVEAATWVLRGDQPAVEAAAIKRLPTWIERPVDTIVLPRTILAQVGESADLRQTLNQAINELVHQPRLTAADRHTLAALANMQAGLSDAYLIRMSASRIAVVRAAALERIVKTPPWDPRYRPIWTMVERATSDRPQSSQLQRLAALVRAGGKPSDAQVEQMLAGLQAPAITTRSFNDYLLRRFAGGGPTFDPTWTGQNQTRGVGLWRSYLGRPTARAVRP